MGAQVTLYADGVAIGSVTATGPNMTITPNETFTFVDGTHVITARQTEPGLPESPDSPALHLTICTIAPSNPAARIFKPPATAVLATPITSPTITRRLSTF